jgi:RNA polymerase sigma-70 factor (ECF subfamily)
MKRSRPLQDGDLSRVGSDPDAFEVFYRQHVEAIERFVARRVADRELAADLTADIFVAAIESSASYSARRGSPSAWLFGIARVVVSAERRRGGRERDATGRLLGRRLLDADDFARLDERLDAETHGRRLYLAMGHLSEGQRAVLELVAVDGLSLGEAAAALGIAPLAARARLHRARMRMADQLSEYRAPEHSSPRPQEAAP